jgi:hypothetical protein
MKKDKLLSFRAPADFEARCEHIRAAIAKTGPDVKLSAVYRLALERGLEHLERQYRVRLPKKPR